MAKAKKSGGRKPARTAAQKAATRKMIAANKARKSGGRKAPKAKCSGIAKRGSAPPAGLGARVAKLEGKVADLRTDVDAHTSLFRHIANNSRGLFASGGGSSSARQLGAGR